MSVRDIVVMAALVLATAILLTAHVWIVIGLARTHPRWRALVAVLVVPLAPYWALRARMRVRGIAWIVGAVIEMVALVMAFASA